MVVVRASQGASASAVAVAACRGALSTTEAYATMFSHFMSQCHPKRASLVPLRSTRPALPAQPDAGADIPAWTPTAPVPASTGSRAAAAGAHQPTSPAPPPPPRAPPTAPPEPARPSRTATAAANDTAADLAIGAHTPNSSPKRPPSTRRAHSHRPSTRTDAAPPTRRRRRLSSPPHADRRRGGAGATNPCGGHDRRHGSGGRPQAIGQARARGWRAKAAAVHPATPPSSPPACPPSRCPPRCPSCSFQCQATRARRPDTSTGCIPHRFNAMPRALPSTHGHDYPLRPVSPPPAGTHPAPLLSVPRCARSKLDSKIPLPRHPCRRVCVSAGRVRAQTPQLHQRQLEPVVEVRPDGSAAITELGFERGNIGRAPHRWIPGRRAEEVPIQAENIGGGRRRCASHGLSGGKRGGTQALECRPADALEGGGVG